MANSIPQFPRPWIVIPNRSAFQQTRTLLGQDTFTALSPRFAGSAFGWPWWQAVLQDAETPSCLDCGEAVALALHVLQLAPPQQGVICRNIPQSLHQALPPIWQARLLLAYPANAQPSGETHFP